MHCQHGMCRTCLQRALAGLRRPPLRCPVCTLPWSGPVKNMLDPSDPAIMLPLPLQIGVAARLVQWLQGPLIASVSIVASLFLLMASVYQSATWVLFSGLVVGAIHQLKVSEWWLFIAIVFLTYQSHSWEPLVYSFACDLAIRHAPVKPSRIK